MNSTQQPNRLIHEKSPYLLQHAYNPVDWWPWCNEAFAKAKAEDKPVFLSVGYSTCHWCHVMERESFEDDEVAARLNRDFVCIKVDKEERPDVDAVYMAVCQALTGQGGWPMTILMTPEQKPFFAGTYFPKQSRYGMSGLMDMLAITAKMWKNQRVKLLETGEDIHQHFQHKEPSRAGEVTTEFVDRAVSYFRRSFDKKNGGFGGSPKFPTPHNLLFLMRVAQEKKDDSILQMVEKTLEQMARGGIFDHVGGGFSRYSTDSHWLAPHFEKMLYDNAMLSIAYLEAYQITKKPFYRHVVERTLAYVLREMTDPLGGFTCAQDADSEGEEGKYYVFKESEILQVLGQPDGRTFCDRLDITPEGNFEGSSIPNRLHDDQFEEPMPSPWLEKLAAYRKQRTMLHLDDKVLTAWNGLMVAALAKAYQVLDDERYLTAARRAMSFVLTHMAQDSRLSVWYRDGKSGGNGHLDDYAFVVWALLELYNATYEPVYLEQAIRLNEQQMQDFFDTENGGCYLYGRQSEQLIMRPKEVYDGAIPSGNSATALNLQRLSQLTGDAQIEEWAQRQLEFLGGQIQDMPAGYSFSMLAVMQALYPTQLVVCALPEDTTLPEARRLLHASFRRPRMAVLMKTPKSAAAIETLAPFTKGNDVRQGVPTMYVCENHACSAPVCGPEAWEAKLASLQG